VIPCVEIVIVYYGSVPYGFTGKKLTLDKDIVFLVLYILESRYSAAPLSSQLSRVQVYFKTVKLYDL
jgi:hypothetical protein